MFPTLNVRLFCVVDDNDDDDDVDSGEPFGNWLRRSNRAKSDMLQAGNIRSMMEKTCCFGD